MTNHILKSDGFILVSIYESKIIVRHEDLEDEECIDYQTKEKALEVYNMIYEQLNQEKFTSF